MYDYELEKQLLSYLFFMAFKKKEILKVIEDINVDIFYNLIVQKIFKAIKKLIIGNNEVTYQTIQRETNLKLSEIVDYCSTSINYNYKSIQEQLIDLRNKRLLKDILLKTGDIKKDTDINLSLKYINENIREIYKSKSNISTIKEIVQEGKRLEEIEKMESGIELVDKYSGGLSPQQVWVIGGATGTGKSLFVLQFVLKQILDNKKVLFFSTEISSWQNIKRLRRMIVGLNLCSQDEAEDFILGLDDMIIFIDNQVTIEGIEMISRSQKIKRNIDLIIIDHLHNLRGKSVERYEEILETTSRFQEIAKELKVGIILVSQLNKEGEFRGANKIAEVGDFGLIIKRKLGMEEDDDCSETTLEIVKNRNGQYGGIKVKFNVETLMFESI